MDRIRTQGNFTLLPTDKERPSGLSRTIPDESMSIKEILKKHVSGMPMPATYKEGYEDNATFDSPDMEKLPRLDLFDLEEFRTNLAEEMKQMDKSLKTKAEQDKKKADARKAEEDEVREMLRQRRDAETVQKSSDQGGKSEAK